MSSEEQASLARLEQRAAEWLTARAAGRSTEIADARVSEAMTDYRRAERERQERRQP